MTTPTTTPRPFTHEAHAFDWLKLHHRPIITAVIAGFLVVVGVRWWVDRRKRRRQDAWHHVADPIIAALGNCPVWEPKRGRTCRRVAGRVVYLRLGYGTLGKDHGPAVDALPARLAARMGGDVNVQVDTVNRIVTVRLVEAEKVVEETPVGLVERAGSLARQLLGSEAKVTHPALKADGTFERFTIEHESIKDADRAEQAKIDNAVQKKLGQKFQPKWEPHNDRVTYRASPDLPAFVPHPVGVTMTKPTQIPFAVDAHGRTIFWDLRVSPHALVCGPTNGGKSTTLMTMVTEMCARDMEVRVCDVKRTSLLGLKGWPGVTEHATEPEDIAACILGVEAEMQRRYTAVEAAFDAGREAPEMKPLTILIDETWETIEVLNEAVKGRDDAPAVKAFRSITRLGRQGDVHIIAAFQQPDARVLSGESRQNFGCRVLLGDRKRALPMLELSRVVSSPAVGRAMVNAGDGEHEAQIWFTPDFAEYRKLPTAQKEILDNLRRAGEQARNTAVPTFHVTPSSEPPRPVLTLLKPEPTTAKPAEKPDVKVCLNASNPDRICVSAAQGVDPEFGVDTSRTDGMNPRCKACERERFAEIRAAKRKTTPRS